MGGRSDRERIQKQGWGFNTLWVIDIGFKKVGREGESVFVCLRRMALVAGLCLFFWIFGIFLFRFWFCMYLVGRMQD